MKIALKLVMLALFLPMLAQAQNKPETSAPPRPAPVMRTYRLTYTLTESDGGKKLGVQHFSTLIHSQTDGRASIRLGSKIPVGATADKDAQISYMDVGLNITAMVYEYPYGEALQTTVEQSSLIDSPATGPAHPIIRQSSLSSSVSMPLSKPTLIGSLDTPGSTRHLDVEVAMDLVP